MPFDSYPVQKPACTEPNWKLDILEPSLQTALKHCRQYIAWFLSKKQSSESQRFLAEMETLLNLAADQREQHALEHFTSVLEENPDDWQTRKARGKLFLKRLNADTAHFGLQALRLP